jgi:hypothetical protein
MLGQLPDCIYVATYILLLTYHFPIIYRLLFFLFSIIIQMSKAVGGSNCKNSV